MKNKKNSKNAIAAIAANTVIEIFQEIKPPDADDQPRSFGLVLGTYTPSTNPLAKNLEGIFTFPWGGRVKAILSKGFRAKAKRDPEGFARLIAQPGIYACWLRHSFKEVGQDLILTLTALKTDFSFEEGETSAVSIRGFVRESANGGATIFVPRKDPSRIRDNEPKKIAVRVERFPARAEDKGTFWEISATLVENPQTQSVEIWASSVRKIPGVLYKPPVNKKTKPPKKEAPSKPISRQSKR